MNILDFETVDSIPALYHPELDLLVISDLHLGLEGSMTSEGNYVPKFQLDELLEDIQEARKLTEVSRILVNGDLKNEFSRSSYTEKTEIEDFLEFLNQNFEEVILIQGNHDTFVDSIARDQELELKDYHLEKGVLFTHGHLELEELGLEQEYSTIVIGHEHPSLALKDDIGVKEKIDCFLYGKTRKDENIIVLPAFAHVSRGNDINYTPQHKLLSPVLRENVDISSLKAVGVSRQGGLFEFPEIGKL